jgi:hypothetical protein
MVPDPGYLRFFMCFLCRSLISRLQYSGLAMLLVLCCLDVMKREVSAQTYVERLEASSDRIRSRVLSADLTEEESALFGLRVFRLCLIRATPRASLNITS